MEKEKKYRVNNFFLHKNGALYHLVGACNGNSRGLVGMCSVQYGWSYTGRFTEVNDTQNITPLEFKEILTGKNPRGEITGCHIDYFKLISNPLKAKSCNRNKPIKPKTNDRNRRRNTR